MTVTIKIDYKILNSLDWHTISLTPEEYFDKSYFEEYPDEEFEWNSVSEFDDTIDYLDLDPSTISHTRIRIYDDKANASRILSETRWNNGESFIAERIDKHLEETNELMVISIKLRENPTEWEILRIQKEDGMPVLEFHSIITDMEDGSQEERIIYPVETSDSL
jgi:hypothetical protein